MERLVELETFVAVVDRGGFAAAARALGRSAPSVTRIVGDLEARLDVRLLDRTSRRCLPTDAGTGLVEDARHVLIGYEEALSKTRGEAIAPRGLIRITAPLAFGRAHVAPALVDFTNRHQAISVALDVCDRVQDLHEEGFDLTIRTGRIEDASLIVRRIGWVKRMIAASPAYLAQAGTPATPEAVADHQTVHQGGAVDSTWSFKSADGAPLEIAIRPRLMINQAEAAVAAARAGHGLVNALSYQLQDDLESGRLVRVLAPFETEPRPLSLVWPEGRQKLRRLRMLIDHLASFLPPRLSGELR
ncbi:MAG: LysR family transcriptional regulator [Sphingomonas sp.]